MKVSLWPNLRHPPADVLGLAKQADAAGWYGVWLADHHMPDTGTAEIMSGDMHEVWGVLPAVAAVTRRMRVGTLVSPTTMHHPALLAKRGDDRPPVGGRMVLGDRGGMKDQRARRVRHQPQQAREPLRGGLQIVGEVLTKERTTFHGSFFR